MEALERDIVQRNPNVHWYAASCYVSYGLKILSEIFYDNCPAVYVRFNQFGDFLDQTLTD